VALHYFVPGGIYLVAIVFFAAFICALGATYGVRFLARRWGVVDIPDARRKRHERPVALLGGVALFLSFWFVVACSVLLFPQFGNGKVTFWQVVSVFFASCCIMIVGIFDERKGLSPRKRFVATLGIAAIPILGGIGLDGITNPFGGTIGLDWPRVSLPFVQVVLMIGDGIVFVWLLGMMYTTKLLDGLDGLATGVAGIGGMMIILLTLTPRFFQPDVGLLASAFTGVCGGFLIFNRKPASIFLGETGSLFLGFMLGILAVISGGKIATALLVMAVPILDVCRVIIVRLLRRQKVFEGDREHLHYRLLDLGFSERFVVRTLYAVAFLFGVSTLFLPSTGKIIVLSGLLFTMIILSIALYYHSSLSKKI
jgi:UDP-GlcNAc:undecaprenyl-phosphate GlcNAc-1-phosphate transferase